MKRPELDPKMNLKGRQDYMDVEYVNGLYEANGNELMRKLTDKEKDFLSQFYKEWLNADRKDSEFYSEDSEWKQIYQENNARNRCLLNKTKKMNKLENYDIKKKDKRITKELDEYDPEQLLLGIIDNQIDDDSND